MQVCDELLSTKSKTQESDANIGRTSIKAIVRDYKDALGAAKDMLDVAIRITPIILFVPALTLWMYLRDIGWEEIYVESVSSLSGLTILVVAGLVLALAGFLQLCIPSILLAPASELYLGKREHVTAATWLHVWPSIVLLASVWTISLAMKEVQSWIPIGLSSATAIGIVFRRRNELLPIVPEGKYKRIRYAVTILGRALVPFMCSLATSFPLLLLLPVFNGRDVTGWQIAGVIAICSFATLVGMAPGITYFNSRVSGQSRLKSLQYSLVATGIAGYLLFGFAICFVPVRSTVLRASGIQAPGAHVYQLLRPELAGAFRAAHIHVAVAKSSVSGGNRPETYFIGGYLRYNFGNIKLICRTTYNTDITPKGAGGQFCVPAKADEVRRVRF